MTNYIQRVTILGQRISIVRPSRIQRHVVAQPWSRPRRRRARTVHLNHLQKGLVARALNAAYWPTEVTTA